MIKCDKMKKSSQLLLKSTLQHRHGSLLVLCWLLNPFVCLFVHVEHDELEFSIQISDECHCQPSSLFVCLCGDYSEFEFRFLDQL